MLTTAAIKRYARTHRALDENSIREYAAGVEGETAEFLRLNDEAYEAARGVPQWLQWLIDRRITRELDYWPRMDAISECRAQGHLPADHIDPDEVTRP